MKPFHAANTTGITPEHTLPTSRSVSRKDRWLRRRLGVARLLAITLLLLVGMLAGMERLQADSGDNEVELRGLVVSRPAGVDGLGEWVIRGKLAEDQAEQEYTVIADEATKFKDTIPQVNDRVKVKGLSQDDGSIQAEKMEMLHDNGDGNEIKGVVESRPPGADGIGTWVIRIQSNVTRTVIADSQTQFKEHDGAPQIPEVGDWVEVKGAPLPDGTFLARRIRRDDFEEGRLVVRLESGVISNTFALRYRLTPLRTVLPSGDIHLFATENITDDVEGLAQRLANDPDVVWAELNYRGGIPEGDPYDFWEWGGTEASGYVNQKAFSQVRLPAQPMTYTGAGMVVAVLDTGVSQDHPAFAGRLLPGWDMVDDDPIPNDEPGGAGWGHGTHVAGIIAHVAPEAQILPVRVLDPQGRGDTFVVAYAIEWAVNQGADVINMSLGTAFHSQVLSETVAWATDQGVVIVAAAGNLNSTQPQYPAHYPQVVSVTGVDEENRKAPFANYGEGWIDVAAPSVGITSTIVGPQGNGYASWSGTSMATAFVSGAAALGRQKFPNMSVGALEQRLEATAQDIDSVNPDYKQKLGKGLLDVSALLEVPAQPPPAYTEQVYLPLVMQ